MKQMFASKGMKATTLAFDKACLVYRQTKPNRSRDPGLLALLPVPNGAWQVISMDFIEGLPRSGVANCILVVVDKFLKYHLYISGCGQVFEVPLFHSFATSFFNRHCCPSLP
jgi:hypothetical protein